MPCPECGGPLFVYNGGEDEDYTLEVLACGDSGTRLACADCGTQFEYDERLIDADYDVLIVDDEE